MLAEWPTPETAMGISPEPHRKTQVIDDIGGLVAATTVAASKRRSLARKLCKNSFKLVIPGVKGQ